MAELTAPAGPRPFPLIDSDPHFSRVVRYMRSSDYAVWAATTVAAPAFLYAINRIEPVIPTETSAKVPADFPIPKPKLDIPISSSSLHRAFVSHLRLGGLLGFTAGFILAYQRSSYRFWGWSENKREQDRDFAELSERARQGKPLWGESTQPEWIQAAAHRNSLNSQLKLQTVPWFNFVNHPYHGVDPAKYHPADKKAEDK